MTRSPLRMRLSGAALLLAVALPAGCDSSTTATSGSGFGGPPRLRIDEIRSAGGPTWTPRATCLEVGHDPQGTVAVLVGEADALGQLVNWDLEAPGACENAPQCGFLQVTVERCADDACASGTPLGVVVAASRVVSVELGRLVTPPAKLRFRVQLHLGDGTLALDAEGDPFEASAVVELRATCDGAADAGPDGSPDGGPPDAAIPDAAPDAPAALDAAPDAPAALDAAPDAPAALDAAPDATIPDASPDASVDAASESGADGGSLPDASAEGGGGSPDASDARAPADAAHDAAG